MIELDILIEEIELSNMSRVSKKYIYENLLDIRQKITKQLTLCDVSSTLKAYAEWQDNTRIDLGAYTNEEQYKLYLDSF